MKILILGAGRVGQSVAETLASEANDITIIDPDPERLRGLEERLELRGVVGKANAPSLISDGATANRAGVATLTAATNPASSPFTRCWRRRRIIAPCRPPALEMPHCCISPVGPPARPKGPSMPMKRWSPTV